MIRGTTEVAQNPAGALLGEVQDALDSPSAAYYLGGKTADGACALPGMLFGGEEQPSKQGLGQWPGVPTPQSMTVSVSYRMHRSASTTPSTIHSCSAVRRGRISTACSARRAYRRS